MTKFRIAKWVLGFFVFSASIGAKADELVLDRILSTPYWVEPAGHSRVRMLGILKKQLHPIKLSNGSL